MSVLVKNRAIVAFLLTVTILANSGLAQTDITSTKVESNLSNGVPADEARPLVVSLVSNYYSQVDGMMLAEIVRRAIETNGDIKIARLEVEKAKARLTQAGLRPNPTLEV